MSEYYTNSSEYSPSVTRYASPVVQVNPPPVQVQPVQLQPIAPQYVPYPAAGPYKYNSNMFHLDFRDIIKRGIKYLIEGLAVAFVAYYFIGKGRFNVKDIVYLGITAAFVFAILDTFSPTISLGARFGAGFGIGQGLFGLNPGLITPVI
jgi:hypothetical protein